MEYKSPVKVIIMVVHSWVHFKLCQLKIVKWRHFVDCIVKPFGGIKREKARQEMHIY